MWLFQELWLLPHFTALGTLAFLSVRLVSNLRFLRRAAVCARLPGGHLPRVSVLIPARNEAATIRTCVMSLLGQRYPNLEIIALDDASTDETGALLHALRAQSAHFKVLHQTSGPPPGWNGKSYACHVLARHATGEWLLFTDADTIHKSDSVERGVAYADRLNAALVSVFPHQRVHTWSERLLVSFLLDFLPLLTVDFAALAHGKVSRVAANGQFLLVSAARYRALGGHASIQHALIDDFALARRFQATGHRIALIQGEDLLTCRMYRSAGEVWGGFSKNVLGALNVPPRLRALLWVPLFAWLYACLFVLPFAHVVSSRQWILAVVEVGWLLLLRGVVVWRLKRPPGEVLTTPFAAWGTMILGMNALVQRWRNAPLVWKGRTYLR